jgi:dipeptidyl aminopeptidase/acylaminoacyl peptidase
MTPEVIRRQVVLEEFDLAPDGRLAVVTCRRVRGNLYVSTLDAVDLAAGRAARRRPLTSGPVRDRLPRVSPDGRTVAFVRSDPAEPDVPARLCLVPIRGGRVRELPIGDHGGVEEHAWSPDGRRIAFTAEVDPPRFLAGPVAPAGRRPRRDSRPDPAPLARRIARIDWRLDGSGLLDRWAHLFVVDVDAGPGGRAARTAGRTPRQVTSGDWGVSGIAWHPDGRIVAFEADRRPDADLRPRPTIHAVDVDGPGTVREVLAAGGYAAAPSYAPGGAWLAASGVLAAEPTDDISPGLVVGPADGSGPPVLLAPELDRPIGNATDTDLVAWRVDRRYGPFWLDDRTVVALVTDRGRSFPMRFTFDAVSGAPGGAQPVCAPTDIVCGALALAMDGTIAALAALGDRAAELVTFEPEARRGGVRRRTWHGSAWQRGNPRPGMRSVLAPGPGGPIETWIVSPHGAPDRPLPTIVDVHGGPLGSWNPAPPVEAGLLTARGYRVVLPNIRGSASYGADWIRPQLGDWGGVDADDVHAALDHVIELGLANPDRLGVLGLSYGGFMAHWLIGTSDRFGAAVSENGVTNQVADWANSDSGVEYDRMARLGDPLTPEGVERLWRQSPLANVASIRTPLLMLQGEADLRCPPADNEQLFVALRTLGRTVEYVLYPEESHVYSVLGRPDRRMDRMTRMLDWFDRYLGPG